MGVLLLTVTCVLMRSTNQYRAGQRTHELQLLRTIVFSVAMNMRVGVKVNSHSIKTKCNEITNAIPTSKFTQNI